MGLHISTKRFIFSQIYTKDKRLDWLGVDAEQISMSVDMPADMHLWTVEMRIKRLMTLEFLLALADFLFFGEFFIDGPELFLKFALQVLLLFFLLFDFTADFVLVCFQILQLLIEI